MRSHERSCRRRRQRSDGVAYLPKENIYRNLILYSAGFLAGHIRHFHSIFTSSDVIINQSAFRIFLHHPIRCGHAVAVNQSDVALFIFTFGREALAGIHQKVRHISKHLLAYAHKCSPTCKSSILAQPASRQDLKAK